MARGKSFCLENSQLRCAFDMKRCILFLCIVGTVLCYKWDLNADLRNCKPDCDSQIFCRGEILHDVQTNRVFPDGTTFVEKRLLFPEAQIVDKYRKLKQRSGGRLSVAQLRQFVDQNFANDSLPACQFDDFNPRPSILSKTTKPKYKNWLTWLNNRWVQMGGELDPSVKRNPQLHSYLYVPNRFVKAGGRFTGTYYWDSYWIIRGLLLSDMHVTARGMVENVIYLVEQLGHMPNGNRNYYTQRSQPPMLIQMAAEYYQMTNNVTFIKKNLKTFEKEFQFWDDHRSVIVEKGRNKYKMYRYKTLSCDPRPESYYEDYNLVKNMTDPEAKMEVLTGVRSAAESGWDFSSRHMRGVNNSNNGTLRKMDTMDMIYVDLNSIIHANLELLATWEGKCGSQSTARRYQEKADKLKDAIEEVLWNEEVGSWLDYDLITEQSRNYFYVSNLTPLWSKSYRNPYKVNRVVRYLKNEGIINENSTPRYFCIPTSVDNSTQQWDFPNCWAPLQAFAIHGLHSSGNREAEQIAFNLAQAWIQTTYEGFRNSTEMYEKYDALTLGSSGGGGEYVPQTGFGWTNGLCMDFFNTWGDKLQ